jgi:hypothetical protein
MTSAARISTPKKLSCPNTAHLTFLLLRSPCKCLVFIVDPVLRLNDE